MAVAQNATVSLSERDLQRVVGALAEERDRYGAPATHLELRLADELRNLQRAKAGAR